MENLPRPDMILSGLFLQIFVGNLISLTSENHNSTKSVMCTGRGIALILLIVISAGVAFLTAIKSQDRKVAHGMITFAGSFLLNLAGDELGYLAVRCARDALSSTNIPEIYTYVTMPIMALASIVITVVYLLNKKTLESNEKNAIFPDIELILLGICIQYTFWGCISVPYDSPFLADIFCQKGGVGSWLELLAVSGILTVFNLIKEGASLKLLFTFIGSLTVNLTLGKSDWMAMTCANPNLNNHETTYLYITLIIHGIAAIVLKIVFLNGNPASSQNPGQGTQHTQLLAVDSNPSYPLQPAYPPAATNPLHSTCIFGESNSNPQL